MINIDEKESVLLVSLHAIDEIYQADNNFSKIKNFGLKTYLGDGIYVDYDKPFLTLKTDNSFGDFLNGAYKVGSYIPIVSTVLSGSEFVEGIVQENEEQVIDGGFSLAVDALTFGWGKAAKASQAGQKAVMKTITKGVAKETTKKVTQKPLMNIVKTFLKDTVSPKNFLKKDIIDDLKGLLKENVFLPQPVVIDLENNTQITVTLKQKLNYFKIDNNDNVVVVNHEGKIVDFNE